MLRDESRVMVEDTAWVGSAAGASATPQGASGTESTESAANDNDWRAADRHLRTNAKQRAALDAVEAFWLRAAERLQIWRPLGMVSMLDYLERVLGYAPRTGQDRLQVARALGQLPVLTAALDEGSLSFSAIKELVRVATPTTEGAWRDEAIGKNQRQIEELVAEHAPGDLPDDPPDPTVRTYPVRYDEITAATLALQRQARLALDEQHGRHLSDDEILAAMSTAVLERGGGGGSSGETTGLARFQIGIVVCACGGRAWQEGGGKRVPIDAATLERACCDAQHLGPLDAEVPQRAYQDISPAIARLIHRRDQGRCQTPGCRSALGLEIHHIIQREHGGTHVPSNLTLRCGACHTAHHRGDLTISGTAPHHLETRRTNAPIAARAARPAHPPAAHTPVATRTAANQNTGTPAHGDAAPTVTPAAPAQVREAGTRSAPAPARLDVAVRRSQARETLVASGWKTGIARAAVDEALAHVGRDATLEQVIFEAMRRCPRPRS